MNADGIVKFGYRFDVSAKKLAMMELRQWHGVTTATLSSEYTVQNGFSGSISVRNL